MKISRDLGFILIDIIVVISGIALLLIMGYSGAPTLRTLLEAVGTSLIAAGFVSYLTRRLYSQEKRDTIRVVAANRMVLEDEYERRKYSAEKIDIVGIALSGCLRELANDQDQKLLRRVLFDCTHVRLMFLSPLANYVHQRAAEDSVKVTELQDILRQEVRDCIGIYLRLRNLYQSASDSGAFDRTKVGGFEIRLIDMCPHSTVYRTDDMILWGIYTSAGRGLDSAVLCVPEDQNVLFGQLVSHFEKLWDKNLSGKSGDNYLVRYYVPNVPTLNEDLLEEVLGAEWKEQFESSTGHSAQPLRHS